NPPAQNEQPSATPSTDGGYADGVYYAEGAMTDSGWQDVVALKVEGGKITEANWNALSKDGGLDKKSFDKAGKYGMKAKAGAQADWYEQAEKAEAYLLEKQEPAAISYTDDQGHTDAISGVSIHVKELFELAAEALEAGPVANPVYKDGTYFAEEAEFAQSGWKYNATI